MKIGVVANTRKPDARATVDKLRRAFAKIDASFLLEKDTAALMGEDAAADFTEGANLVVSLGGDGTLLETLRRMNGRSVPVAGINIGTLGFLTTCQDEHLDAFAKCVMNGTYQVVERTMLEVTVVELGGKEQQALAVNEVVIARGETGRMVSLEARVNGDLLNDYNADGLIVATPTGSTAYSLSAGGPLIEPRAAVFVVTPICPHSLTNRSLIISDQSEVTIHSLKESPEPILFTVDGRKALRVEPGTQVSVRKAQDVLHLVRMPEHSFYETLRKKLHWH